MNKLKFILLCVIFIYAILLYSNEIPSSIKTTTEAYWFIYQQQYLANKYILKYPEYKMDIENAIDEFDATFGKAKGNMEKVMKNELGEQYSKEEDRMKGNFEANKDPQLKMIKISNHM